MYYKYDSGTALIRQIHLNDADIIIINLSFSKKKHSYITIIRIVDYETLIHVHEVSVHVRLVKSLRLLKEEKYGRSLMLANFKVAH